MSSVYHPDPVEITIAIPKELLKARGVFVNLLCFRVIF